MKKLILFFAALCCMTLAHADVIWRTSCKPTSTQRGFTIGCYEDTATGKIYTNKSCDYERNAAEVVWYSKLKTSPVSDDGDREVKEADVHMGFPFFWAADNSMGRYDQGTKSVEFKASDSGIANARLKWYANGIVAIGHNIKIAVKVNGTLVDEYYCRNNKMDALEMVNSVPLVGLKAGDVVTFETIKDANDNESYATIAASLEYTGTDVSDGPHLPITVAADDQRRMVDAADPELTWQLTGALFPGDNLANITINRETGEASGTYAIVVSQSQGANPDYDINFVPSTFTIVNSAHRMPATATFRTRGFSQECWEDLTNGKLYADGYFKQELNPGLVISYAKLLDNPITELNGFRLSDTFAFNGATFDWGPQSMVVFYPSDPSDPHYTGPEDIQRHVDFTVLGTNVADARVKWYKGLTDRWGGPLYVNIYVNGEKVYSQRHANGLVLEDVYTHSLPDLKTGDVVRFEVYVVDSDYPSVTMNFAACLEYTSSNGGKEATVGVTAKQNNRNKGSYYATFYSSTCAYKVPDGVTAYTGVVDGGCLRMTAVEGNIIPQGEPVVLKATVAPQAAGMLKGSYDERVSDTIQFVMKPAASTALPSEDNDLVGTENGFATAPANSWMLSVNAYYAGFFPLNPGFIPSEGSSIAPNSAYLQFDYPVDVISLELKFDQDIPTGVEDLKHDRQGDGRKYDILGRPVGDDYKGIVIMNGKKSLSPTPLQ